MADSPRHFPLLVVIVSLLFFAAVDWLAAGSNLLDFFFDNGTNAEPTRIRPILSIKIPPLENGRQEKLSPPPVSDMSWLPLHAAIGYLTTRDRKPPRFEDRCVSRCCRVAMTKNYDGLFTLRPC